MISTSIHSLRSPLRACRPTRAALYLALQLLPGLGQAQTPPLAVTSLTLLSSPPEARITLVGESRLMGPAPIEVPPAWKGRFKIRVEAEGCARSDGALLIPEGGGAPRQISDPPGWSPGLMIRSLNFPGIPDLSSDHRLRGTLLFAAATGAGAAALRAHRFYRRDIGRDDVHAGDRAEDYRIQRNRWTAYGAGVWALSAVDYWMRPRVQVLRTTPDQVTLGTPAVTRGGVVIRSLLVPGAGQEFANQRFRGAFWLTATMAAGAGFVLAENAVDRHQSRARWARALVDSAGPSEFPARLRSYEHELTSLESARDYQRGFRIAAVTMAAANFVDALFLPLSALGSPSAPRVSLAMPVSPDAVTLRIDYSF